MARIAAFFVAICMVLIAAAVGALLYLWIGLSGTESALVGLACLSALALYNAATTRVRDRSNVGGQIADLSRGTGDLARQVAELGRRVTAMEGKVERAGEIARAAADPLAAEIGELGALMTQLAESVAAHDIALAGRGPALLARQPAAPAGLPAIDSPATIDPGELGAPERKPSNAGAVTLSSMPHDGVVALVRSALEANRVDLYLQPIVTLPQRKVRYYEAVTRLRTEDGDVVAAVEFLVQAEAADLMPQIDNLLLFRCVQVVRRLLLKNRDIGLFCNISPSTLASSASFPQFLEFVEANRALAPSLVFEFTQSALRNMGPMERESLAALADRGFRFSMDHVTDLRIEPRDLAERGIRFIKVPSTMLLDRAGSAGGDIHPADLSDLLGRSGIDLIAERVESEGAVVDLLDHDLRFGQGFLFSPPRPVRAEALQGIAERPDPGVRNTAPAEPRRGELRGNLQLARGIARRI
jgi:cyclic-di-GMP phosphodiesterase TipF (flagellum assembly factor)